MLVDVLQNKTLEGKEDTLFNSLWHNRATIGDQYLLEQIECKNSNAMQLLYKRYYTSLASFINMCLSDDQDTADILQDSFLDIWLGKKIWDRRQSVKVFILSIIRKKIDNITKVVKRNFLHEKAVAFSCDDLERQTKQSRFQDPLKHLSPRCKSLLFLLYKESLSYEQIAIIESCTVSSVKRRFLEASRRLKMQVN